MISPRLRTVGRDGRLDGVLGLRLRPALILHESVSGLPGRTALPRGVETELLGVPYKNRGESPYSSSSLLVCPWKSRSCAERDRSFSHRSE